MTHAIALWKFRFLSSSLFMVRGGHCEGGREEESGGGREVGW